MAVMAAFSLTAMAGSSTVVACWLELGIGRMQVGMEVLIRSHGLWQVACTFLRDQAGDNFVRNVSVL